MPVCRRGIETGHMGQLASDPRCLGLGAGIPHRLRSQSYEGVPGLVSQSASFLGGSYNCLGAVPPSQSTWQNSASREGWLIWAPSVRSCIPGQLAQNSGGCGEIAYRDREDVAQQASPLLVSRNQWRSQEGTKDPLTPSGMWPHPCQLTSSHQAPPLFGSSVHGP